MSTPITPTLNLSDNPLRVFTAPEVGEVLSATLRRDLDGVEKDFGFTSKGYLDHAAVLAWAGASAVTVARMWGLGGEQFGPELFPVTTDSLDGWSLPFGWEAAVSTADGWIRLTNIDAAAAGNKTLTCAVTGLTIGKRYRCRFESRKVVESTAAAFNFSSALLAGSLGYAVIQSVYDAEFTASATTTAFSLLRRANYGATGDYVEFRNVSICEALRHNAVQTTTLDQPPLDLDSNQLRIGAAAGTSLVATMPPITGGVMLRASGGNVYQETVSLTEGQAYNVVSNQALAERVILASDTPVEDVANVKANMVRAWKAVDGMQLGPELAPNGGTFDSADGLTIATGASIADGTLNFDGVTVFDTSTAILTKVNPSGLVVGALYRVVYSIIQSTTNPVSLGISGVYPGTSRTTPGDYVEFIRSTSVADNITLFARGGAAVRTGKIDNISIREVLGGA